MPFLGFNITVKGIEKVQQNLKIVETGLQDFQIGEIINFVCDTVKDEARSKAPVRTGTLRDSIVHWMNNELSGEVAALAPYAAAVEFGYTTKSGKKVPGAKYFTPAAIHGRKLLLDELKKYAIELAKGNAVKPPTAARGIGKGGAKAHKFLYKIQTGSGVRYFYGKKNQTVTTHRQRLRPSGRQTKFGFPIRRGGAKR